MKVKNLIEKLQTCDPEATVIVISDNFELHQSDVEVSFVEQFNEGLEKRKTFFDAFDGESYQKDVWSIFGGNLPVVKIS